MNQKKISVWCWPAGNLEFGVRCPAGAMPVATGPEEELRDAVEVLATKGEGGRLCIGDMPAPAKDTDNSNAILRALWAFQDEVEAALGKRQEVRHA